MSDDRMGQIERGVSKLEGTVDALKIIKPLTIGVMALLTTVLIGAIAFLGIQIARLDQKVEFDAQRLNDKLDAIPQKLTDEFRATRAETAAQTSAIADSITAARQFQPQIIIVPVPTPQAVPRSGELTPEQERQDQVAKAPQKQKVPQKH